MIRELWSKLVRLLSGEMDMMVLRNEVAQKWLDEEPLLSGEVALLETLGKTDSMLGFYLQIGNTVGFCWRMAEALPVVGRAMAAFVERMEEATAGLRRQFLAGYARAVRSPRQ